MLTGPLTISVRGEYALRALFDLTLRQGPLPVKISAIARRQKIPQKFLELILSGLKQAGFVISRRGAEGGYMLARDPGQITVGEVLRFIEAGKAGRRVPKGGEADPFAEMWQRIDAAVSEILDHTTLAALAREWNEKQAACVPNWEI